MLSCHPEPFLAFCKDLQLPGCEVHLYRGAKSFECIVQKPDDAERLFEDESNFYFLGGVKRGLRKRAADLDVLKRGMFTLDFDIRNELQKLERLRELEDSDITECANVILESLLEDERFARFRYVVYSGNGMHVHYFGEPVAVVKEEWSAGMKTIFEDVNRLVRLPCDTGVGNAGRIMRMPGSWNVKQEPRKPVTIEVWNPGETIGDLSFVQERGRTALQAQAEAKAIAQQDFAATHLAGVSGVIALINSIPIEQVVQQLINCTPKLKRDGGMRFVDEHGKERGFFKHHTYNVIVHEGTSLFDPPTDKGYNCLGLVKAVLKVSTPEAVHWFAQKSPRVRQAEEEQHQRWKQEHDIEFTEKGSWRDLLPPEYQ